MSVSLASDACESRTAREERTSRIVSVREALVQADSGVVLAGTFTRPAAARAAGARVARARVAGARLAVAASKPVASDAVDRTTRWPAVLLLSGSGPQDRDGARVELPGYAPFRDIADSLVGDGFAVLRLDDRGTGASGGRFEGATTFDFARDVTAAIRWLRAQPDVDAQRIVLLGHSEGALVAMLAASLDDSVAALVLLGAAGRTGRELARWQRHALVTGDGAVFPLAERASVLARAESEAEAAAEHNRWLQAWFDLDPRVVAKRVRVPTLLLHGANDRQVPATDADVLAVALRTGGASSVEVRRFPSTNHLFLNDENGDPRGYVRLAERRVRPDATRAITDFLLRALR